ncbi:MAG: family 20 glycosylhydrolase, partial [Oscillospiraceae bacterium]
TKDEFRTFTKDSLKQGVIITPEFDMPGHAGAFTAYNPELGTAPGSYSLDLTKKDIVYPFLENLFLEYISGDDPVFVNKDVHIGCDEYGGDSMLYLDFVKHFINFINENGKHPRMWGSFNAHPVPEGFDMPSDATAYMWNAGQSNALTNLALGFDYISVDDSQLYIVPRGGTAAGSYTDYLRNESLYNSWKVSDHDSIPSAHPSQLGALFACWNDVAGSVRYTSYQVFERIFPSIPMLAQRTWSQENQVEYGEFKDVTGNVLKAGPGTDIDVHPQGNEEGTVLSYDFEDGTAADTSGSGNDGVLNGATVVEDPEKGMVASFDGAGTIETALRGIQYPYTISMDIKPDASNTGDATLFSSSYEQFHDLPAGYKYSFIDGALQLKQGENGVVGYTKEWVSHNFGVALTPGVWQNILIQGTEESMVLYIDGREAGRVDRGSGPVMSFVCPLEMIGENFIGRIDNLMISNKDIPQPRNLALGKTAVSNNSELPDRFWPTGDRRQRGDPLGIRI